MKICSAADNEVSSAESIHEDFINSRQNEVSSTESRHEDLSTADKMRFHHQSPDMEVSAADNEV